MDELVPVTPFPRYSATRSGLIYSHASQSYLSQRQTKAGYLQVRMIVGHDEPGGPKRVNLRVHRLVAAAFLGLDISRSDVHVDHINGDRSDNRLDNLRVVSAAENIRLGAMRRVDGVGVTQLRDGRWHAGITLDGRLVSLGTFSTEELALLARRRGVETYWGMGKPLEGANNLA